MDFDAAESQAKDLVTMRLLIDGYNLMFQSVVVNSKKDGKNALRIARGRLMEQLIALLEPEERNQTTIVFDANNAPPGLPERLSQQGIQLIFARDWASADELIQFEIRKHPTPKRLTVVSSDHAIHKKAIARGARVLDSDHWLEERQQLLSDRMEQSQNPEPSPLEEKQRRLSEQERDQWLRDFGL